MLGFVDDLRGLPAVRRLALQASAAPESPRCSSLPLHLPAGRAGRARPASTAVWLIGFVNAFNFMDGVNGISGAHALIGGVAYACLGQWRQDAFLVATGLAVAAGALAFLPWNAVRARVFLGDVGSYALGAALAVLAVTAVIHGVPAEAALGPLALYLADTAWTLQRRMRAGERWLEAHRTHIYQRWCDAGWSHPEVTLVTAATTILALPARGGQPAPGTWPCGWARPGRARRAGGYLARPRCSGIPACAREPARGLPAGGSARRLRRQNSRGSPAEMRILIVTHYFPPETGAPQARLSALAATWAADGDEVTVLTGMPNHPTGVLPPEYRRAVRRRERRDGYRVLRTWLYATPNEGIVRKTLGHLSFMVSSVLLGAAASGPADVVVVSSPTFFSIGSAWLLARLKRARFVVEVRDLWPAIFVELGVLTNRRVIAPARAPGTRRLRGRRRGRRGQRGIPGQPDQPRRARRRRCTRSATASDARAGSTPPRRPDPAVRARLGAGAGRLPRALRGHARDLPGPARRSPTPPRRLAAAPPSTFAFVGDGADKRRLEQPGHRASGLRNVTLLPGVPHAEMPALLAAADICLVPLRDVPLFATFIPSKMFEYLAAGKAVIGSVTGEAAQILREAGAVVVPPEDSAALAAAIRALATSPQRRAGHGPGGPGLRRAVLRPGRAGPRVPQDPRPRRRAAMRLLVTGGSGFLGGYVLGEAARRGHEVVALARSETAAAAVATRGRRAADRRPRRSAPRSPDVFSARALRRRWSTWRRWASGTPRPSSRPPGRRASTAPCSSPPRR